VLGPKLVETVRAAAQARVSKAHRLSERLRLRNRPATAAVRRGPARPAPPPAALRPASGKPFARAVIIGSSTGGPPALDAVLQGLPADFPCPVLVAQHMPASFTGALARRLDRLCALTVTEVDGPAPLSPGHVYIGRGDADLIVTTRLGGPVALPAPPSRDLLWHPSVDRLVDSAAQQIDPERLIGVLLTGMGNDGAAAMTRLRRAGGRTIAESEDTAVVWGMPGELVISGGAEFVAPLEAISHRLLDLVQG
jgi:two-component system chemotaxis response regulator CheB